MATPTITQQTDRAGLAFLILSCGPEVFSVDFVKRSTGEARTMRARMGNTVKKGLRGGPRAYDPAGHGLIWTYLMAGDENRPLEDAHRRSIPCEGLAAVTVAGVRWVASDAAPVGLVHGEGRKLAAMEGCAVLFEGYRRASEGTDGARPVRVGSRKAYTSPPAKGGPCLRAQVEADGWRG